MRSRLHTKPLKQLFEIEAFLASSLGWRRLMRVLSVHGRLLVVNQRKPDAVVLSLEEYTRLVEMAQTVRPGVSLPLAKLRRHWDKKLAPLSEESAGERLRSAMRAPTELDGRVKAGLTY